MSKKEQSEPMDAKAKEVQNPVPATNQQRVCWTLKTLVAEFTELFPETSVEYGNYDGRNTALDVTIYVGGLTEDDEMMATALLRLTVADPRIQYVETEDSNVLVEVQPGPRTQDSREPFDLNDAYMVLVEENDPQEPDGVMDPMFYADMAASQRGGSV